MKIELNKRQWQFDAFYHVGIARGKEDKRICVTKIKVEKERIIATDGRRLHIAYFKHPFKPGLYDVLRFNRTEIILLKSDDKEARFTEHIDVVIPKHSTYFMAGGSNWNGKQWTSPGLDISFGLSQQKIGVMPDYVADATHDGACKVSFGDPAQPVVIQWDTTQFKFLACIMPYNAPQIVVETEPEPVQNVA